MALIAKSEGGGKGYDPVPEGVHHGICVAVYDLGTQYSQTYNNSSRKVSIHWELPYERIDIEVDGTMKSLPMAASKRYTLSLHEKANLRKDLENWRGKAFTEKELEGFDILKLLGINCQLQVIHRQTEKGKTYANVSAILPLGKGMEKKKPENPLRSYSMEDNLEIPEGTPKWIIEIIDASEEKQGREQQSSNYDPNDVPLSAYEHEGLNPDDDIPF